MKSKKKKQAHPTNDSIGNPNEDRTLNLKSSCGFGGIANKGLPAPGQKKFVSKAIRRV